MADPATMEAPDTDVPEAFKEEAGLNAGPRMVQLLVGVFERLPDQPCRYTVRYRSARAKTYFAVV